MTTNATETSSNIDTLALEQPDSGIVTIKLSAPTGEESIDVPAAIAQDDATLRNLLTQHGVSMAANARIERSDTEITLVKQADRLG